MVPVNNSMDSKVEEVLKDRQLDPFATKAIDRPPTFIIHAINSMPDQEADLEHASGFLRDLCVPSITVNFTVKSLESIRIGGNYSIGCATKPDINVDLLICIP
ncbi:hypothetical protein IEQ34_014871 [Dendrobium chrysotoxum]|uniref:Uncharacterized protein n=1 Tax=Dendrobium chrysotoxum TaxID=161865 RepID=A0AAV7GNE0_DENCH|nr:hypothetical protein IEQ34_014871 [Dendrobium chrysotoxum]